MHLPQELLEEILSYLPLDDEQDEQSLRNCSVVARSWVNPSRRRLFKMVGIRNEGIQLWLANVPSTNEGLLQHVRSFSYIIDPTNQRFFFSFFFFKNLHVYPTVGFPLGHSDVTQGRGTTLTSSRTTSHPSTSFDTSVYQTSALPSSKSIYSQLFDTPSLD